MGEVIPATGGAPSALRSDTAPRDAIIIAVDGGGSKTDGVALGLDGTVVAQVRKPGSSPHMIDLAPSVRIVDELVSDLSAAAGNRPILQTNVYLSGLDLPVELSAFAAASADRPWARGVNGSPAVIDNDMFALLRAGTKAPDAVAVVCGTGINCIGVRADGMHARFAALGVISGDWGGGWFLGEQALWHAARAVDGRGIPTSLATRVPAYLGLPDVASVIEAFHFGRLEQSVFPRLAPLVLEAADDGDSAARAILERQAEEVVAMAVAALTRLELLRQPVPVVLGGGVLATGNGCLTTGIETRLAERAPLAHVELVRSRPILGAALLALERVGASPAAFSTAEAALRVS